MLEMLFTLSKVHRIVYKVIILYKNIQQFFKFKEGTLEVSKKSKVWCTIGSGKVFGELAIIYNCTRTASIKGIYSIDIFI